MGGGFRRIRTTQRDVEGGRTFRGSREREGCRDGEGEQCQGEHVIIRGAPKRASREIFTEYFQAGACRVLYHGMMYNFGTQIWCVERDHMVCGTPILRLHVVKESLGTEEPQNDTLLFMWVNNRAKNVQQYPVLP